jgi:hypothetical protein
MKLKCEQEESKQKDLKEVKNKKKNTLETTGRKESKFSGT